MKKFFANMNLARWIMLISVLASIGLAVTGGMLHTKRTDLETALEGLVPRTTQEIQNLSLRYSTLYAEAEREGLKGQSDPQTYFRSLATHNRVMLGQLDIKRMPATTPSKGVEDQKFSIRPQDSDRGVGRTKIANFMFKIEEQSRRVRVTSVRLNREGSLKPWEYGNDKWKWDLEVTSRQKVEP